MKLIFEGRTDYHIYIIEQEGDRDDKIPDEFKIKDTKMAKFMIARVDGSVNVVVKRGCTSFLCLTEKSGTTKLKNKKIV